jgi:hypothetical protein
MGGERIEKGIGSGIRALAGETKDAGHRGEEHEMREGEALGEPVEVISAVDLGREDPREALGRLALQDAVVEHAGAMKDAAERGVRRD